MAEASSSQGRIITENSALLALLRERTEVTSPPVIGGGGSGGARDADSSVMSRPVQRLYVDSPDLVADEEKYKFVSTSVDKFDPTQDQSLQGGPTARGYEEPYRASGLDSGGIGGYHDTGRDGEDLEYGVKPALIPYDDTGGGGHRGPETPRLGLGPGYGSVSDPVNPAQDGRRYEDRDHRRQLLSESKEALRLETEYVVKRSNISGNSSSGAPSGASRASQRDHLQGGGRAVPMATAAPGGDPNQTRNPEKPRFTTNKSWKRGDDYRETDRPGGNQEPRVIQPIRTPYGSPTRDAEDDDERELEKEKAYQLHLRDHISAYQELQNRHIPRLDLDQLDEEEARKIQFPAFDMSDSLDEDEGDYEEEGKGIVQDSLEAEKSSSHQSRIQAPGGSVSREQYPGYPENGGGPSNGLSHADPGMGQGRPLTDRDPRVQEMFFQQQLQQQQMQQQYANEQAMNANNPGQYGNQGYVLSPRQEPFVLQDAHADYGAPMEPSQQAMEQGYGITPGPQYLYDNNGQVYEAYYPGEDEYNSEENDPGQYAYEQDPHSQDQRDNANDPVGESSRFSNRAPDRPGKDYIKQNRNAIAKPPSGKSYRKVFTQRKDMKENPPPSPVLKRSPHAKASSAPQREGPKLAQENAAPSSGRVPEVEAAGRVEKPVSAEQLWRKRSTSLATDKDKKLAGKVPGNNTKLGPLRKFSSEGNVRKASMGARKNDDVKQPLSLSANQNAPRHQPVTAEPITTQPLDANQPIRRTVVTEDGQRLSVDINLKVLSPPPAQKPLGPVPNQQPISPNRFPQQLPLSPGSMQQQQQQFQMLPMQQFVTSPRGFPQQQVFGYPGQPAVTSAANQMFSMPPVPMVMAHNQGPLMNMQMRPPVQPMQAFQAPQGQYFQPTAQDIFQGPQNQYGPRGNGSESVTSSSRQTPTSPYRVLPPIGSADTEQGREGHRVNNPEGQGYMSQYQKQKNRSGYKEYTLEDYKKLNQENQRFGGLGPDRDNETVKEKREKRMRQLEYAKAVKIKGRQDSGQSGRSPLKAVHPKERDDDFMDRRKVALEYAKSVPKPAVRSKPASGGSGHVSPDKVIVNRPEPQLEMIDLHKLQQRHEQERRQVALIRQNVEHVSQA